MLIMLDVLYAVGNKNFTNAISVAECKTMNCIAQALCRKRDDWWKEENAAG